MTTLMTRPRTSAIDRTTAKQLMTTEYQRVVDQLRSLGPGDWSTPTCNTGWDVRALAAHMLGMVAMAASLREMASQMRGAKKRVTATRMGRSSRKKCVSCTTKACTKASSSRPFGSSYRR